MAGRPDEFWFISFHKLDPSKSNQCIHFNKYAPYRRCRSWMSEEDRSRAIELRRTILAAPSEAVTLKQIEDYISYNCCTFASPAGHRHTIKDNGDLTPLARRWQNEIWSRAAASQSISPTPSVPATPTASYTAASPSSTVGPNYQPNPHLSYDVNVVPSASEPGPQLPEKLPLLAVRSREVNGVNSTPGRSASDSEPPQSHFCIYRAEPGPDDSVARQILAPLENNDSITGSLYGFTRDSSPGHIKIGWTAISVDYRLNYWSDHGDEPNILFSVHLVPQAQRAETLIHCELVKERRWERRCQNPDCHVNHMEWFEVSKYRAMQVVADWAEFIERAEPYDEDDGSLKPAWKEVVETMDRKGELVTARKLLEHYEASLVEESTFIETSLVMPEPPIEVEPLSKSKSDDREALTPERSPVKALPIETESDSLPVTRKDLADARIDIKELQEAIASMMQLLRIDELGMQAEPQREVLARDGQIRAKDKEGKPHRQVGSPAGSKNETEDGEDGEDGDEWDPDKTLVEDESPGPLEKDALKRVDGHSGGISAGKAIVVEKGFNRPKVLELEAPPPILPRVGAV